MPWVSHVWDTFVTFGILLSTTMPWVSHVWDTFVTFGILLSTTMPCVSHVWDTFVPWVSLFCDTFVNGSSEFANINSRTSTHKDY